MCDLRLQTFIALAMATNGAIGTDRPIIGILSQELSITLQKYYPDHDSYIAAAYVKSVESSGARVVPILIGQSEAYYREIFASINGILLPGGNTYFKGNGYASIGEKLLNMAKKANQRQDNVPILGICLGFELLLYLDASKRNIRSDCDCSNVALPLDFVDNYEESTLFKDVPNELIDILKQEPVTLNQHRFCITEASMTKYGLDKSWNILTQNTYNEETFVSTVEAKEYPFVGVQFHPEKNAYEWREDKNNPHSYNAVKVSRIFFDWLVNEARKNNHRFRNKEQEISALIFNFSPEYTRGKLLYEQIYLFKNPKLDQDV